MNTENLTLESIISGTEEILSLHKDSKARQEGSGPSQTAIEGKNMLIEHKPYITKKTICAMLAQYLADAQCRKGLLYAHQGYLGKNQAVAYSASAPGPVTTREPMPDHVLTSQGFEETYISRAIDEKGEEINEFLAEKLPQKLRGFLTVKLTTDNLLELCKVYPELAKLVYDETYHQTLQTLKDKEKESQSLLDYLTGLGLSPKLFRERAAFFNCSGKQAKEISDAIVIANSWERKLVTGKNDNTFAKFWSSLNGAGGLGYEKIETDFELSFNCLLCIPAGFTFPEK